MFVTKLRVKRYIYTYSTSTTTEMKNTAIIGKNIKSYREKLHLTQDQVAHCLGVSREMISYYESGSRDIDLSKLEMLADLFGTELISLIEENGDLAGVDLAFAYRADEFTLEDLAQINHFRKIIKNYLKMRQLNEK